MAAANSYNIYWSTGPGVSKTTGIQVAGASSPCRVDNLAFGVTYYFVVTSVAGPGNEGPESAPEASAFVPRSASPQAGSDIEQYVDGAYNNPSAVAGRENYDDRSRHPLTVGTTVASLLFGATQGSQNCLGCHGAKYKSGGAKHFSNECLMCHYENQPGTGSLDNVPGGRHGNGVVELATVNGNDAPVAQFPISSIVDYDSWCLQCHAGTTVTLGGIAPSGKTVIAPAAVANGRHRLKNVGCIYCHHPHGRSNTRTVRENPQNRRSAAATPTVFGVYPDDSTGSHGYPLNQALDYRSRVDNNVADAADANSYCNLACHIARLDDMYRKDKMIRRDNVSGNYLLNPGNNKKVYLVNGTEYTNDNTTSSQHQHPNGEIIPTDGMVQYYAQMADVSGPSYFQYPGAGSAAPMSYNNGASPLPLFPDYADGSRDFTNAYNNAGVRIKYRFTCSTCHNPHGTTLQNGAYRAEGYPDLRKPNSAAGLCVECKR